MISICRHISLNPQNNLGDGHRCFHHSREKQGSEWTQVEKLKNQRFCSEPSGLPTPRPRLSCVGGCGQSLAHPAPELLPMAWGDGLCFSPSCPAVGILGVRPFFPLRSLGSVRSSPSTGSWKESSETCHPRSQFTETETRNHRGAGLAPNSPLGPRQSQACGLQRSPREGPRRGG